MKRAYFNCSAGIAGDMIIASCISAGLSAELLEKNLKEKLQLAGWELEVKDVTKKHFPAVQVNVLGRIKFGSPGKMKEIISKSSLTHAVKTRSLAILDTLIMAEAKVHKLPPEKIHFHELNSIDTLVDVAGSSLAFDMLGIDEICASPLNIGKAAPATLEILKAKGVPVYSSNPRVEMTTPTGAAIISTVARSFGPMPEMKVESSGSGAGSFDFDEFPNVLGVMIGPGAAPAAGRSTEVPADEVRVVETNIDDMDPRIYPYVMERLFGCGAKDVWFSQVIMKKGRPGIVLSAICSKESEKNVTDVLFKETTTLGVRSHSCSRRILKRDVGGERKTAYVPGARPKVKSEFEKAKQQALVQKKPLKNILI